MKCYETLIQMRELYAFVDFRISGDFAQAEFVGLVEDAKNEMDEDFKVATEDQWETTFELKRENGILLALSAGEDQEFGTEDDILVDGSGELVFEHEIYAADTGSSASLLLLALGAALLGVVWMMKKRND